MRFIVLILLITTSFFVPFFQAYNLIFSNPYVREFFHKSIKYILNIKLKNSYLLKL